ncbi:hypothetical protein D9757_013809 [Collybiopsis confluens]|uniref:Uncharacterized protein n=1 Tax=Collybiopsis confluens TaxID=2823264 RepID=A0A8H5CL02_9AGAR|nr:hypothetical protein D9757_013809 [Collybiopsis confluens]
MKDIQVADAKQDSALADDVEKKDLQTPSSDENSDVEELEARLATGAADEEEYLVRDAHDIAIKVLSTRWVYFAYADVVCLNNYTTISDDYELPVVTFRMLFLGLGFSAFGSVLAQLYYFKPQTLLVSQGFLLIMLYFFGKTWEKVLPSHGLWWYLNPGPFNIKEHGSALIMASTASSSATAIQVISVQDLYYNNKLNPGVAIFTLLASQLVGYSFAGL